MENTSVYGGMIFFAMLYSPLDFFMGMVMQMVSRKNETAADRFAVETTGDPQAMADALKKLSAHNLTNLTPHPFYVFLNYSHPPVLERINNINRFETV
jgi:STE24 endopeptidase